MNNLVGTTLGGYRLVEEIGKGGMSTVFKAYQPKLDRWVAVKVLDPVLTIDSTATIARFRQEARAIASLRHPNILSIFDYGDAEGLEYFVTEYVADGTLRDALRKGSLPLGTAISLIVGVGQALIFAHSHDIVHRDVKPANILLPKIDWPLLADFGLAKLLQDRKRLTDPGTTLGTPEYTAPEQALGEMVDARSDIYSLAVVLFETIAGHPPFQSDKPFDVLLMHIGQQPPGLNQNQGLSATAPLNRLLKRAMAKNPDQRFERMADMIANLESIARDLPELEKNRPVGFESPPPLSPRLAAPCLILTGVDEMVPLPSKQELLVGRTDPRQQIKADVDLAQLCPVAAGVSRRHARLLNHGSDWQIEDLSSTNGTFLNGRRLPPSSPTQLNDGDTIGIGQVEMTFRTG